VNAVQPPGFGGKATTPPEIQDYVKHNMYMLGVWDLLSLQKLCRQHWIKFMDAQQFDGVDWAIEQIIRSKRAFLGRG
jgi:hypothetical protein